MKETFHIDDLDDFVDDLEQKFDHLLNEIDELLGDSKEKEPAKEPEKGMQTDTQTALQKNMEEDDLLIELKDENGNPIQLMFLDLIEYNHEEYAVFLPKEEQAEDALIVLKLEDTGDPDEETYVSVEDDKTLEAVYRIFKEKYKDVLQFEA